MDNLWAKTNRSHSIQIWILLEYLEDLRFFNCQNEFEKYYVFEDDQINKTFLGKKKASFLKIIQKHVILYSNTNFFLGGGEIRLSARYIRFRFFKDNKTTYF